jgi:hypothetical protein
MWDAIYHRILRPAMQGGVVESARKRMQITIETDQVTVIRRPYSARGWCQECGCEVDVVRIEDGGVLAGMTRPVLRENAGTRRWHLSETTDGSMLVCLVSLLKSM